MSRTPLIVRYFRADDDAVIASRRTTRSLIPTLSYINIFTHICTPFQYTYTYTKYIIIYILNFYTPPSRRRPGLYRRLFPPRMPCDAGDSAHPPSAPARCPGAEKSVCGPSVRIKPYCEIRLSATVRYNTIPTYVRNYLPSTRGHRCAYCFSAVRIVL